MIRCSSFVLAALVSLALPAGAQALEPARSWHQLPSSNGYTGVVVDLEQAKVPHFRDHVYATEEPRWNADGTELWENTGGDCHQPRAVFARDLLYDAYFGVQARGVSSWLQGRPVDLDASGYDGTPDREGRDGGTGIVRMVQPLDDAGLRVTTRVFAPWSLERAAFVMLLEVENTGAEASGPVNVYALLNAHLGFGRPGPEQDLGAEFETITRLDDQSLTEQGFAGALYAAPLGGVSRTSHSPALIFETVRDGAGELPLPETTPVMQDDAVGGFQWSLAGLDAGARAWMGLVVSHHPDPDATADLKAEVDGWIAGRTPQDLWQAEREGWQAFQARLQLPEGLSEGEADLLHHSAAILRMAQVRESETWLRADVLPETGRLTGIDQDVQPIEGVGQVRRHDGKGAMLASLPPGHWTYAWVRDGAYAIAGLVDAGLHAEARAALEFFLNARANRYKDYEELADVPLGDYALSLTRYHGFGIEESDTLCNGDFNFEWDGFGLFLWALSHYVDETGDTTLLDDHWPKIRDQVAGVAEGLIEPDSGLLSADSSIWEVHWFGKQKHFAYTSITAARGLCDAADLALRLGEIESAARFEAAGRRVRRAIHDRLTVGNGAIASNTEELATGGGFWDAAVVEAVGMGLFDPQGDVARSTLQAIQANLTVPSGMGVMRNDDANDPHDLTPWGGPYDSQEWVFLDYRLSIAARHAGDGAYADLLQGWVRDQSLQNYLLIAENYDPVTGEYRNNAPMIGFGAGSIFTAMRQRAGDWAVDPACGEYFEDETPPVTEGDGGVDGGPTADGGMPADGGETADGGIPGDGGTLPDGGSTGDGSGCGCGAAGGGAAGSLLGLLGILGLRSRRRR